MPRADAEDSSFFLVLLWPGPSRLFAAFPNNRRCRAEFLDRTRNENEPGFSPNGIPVRTGCSQNDPARKNASRISSSGRNIPKVSVGILNSDESSESFGRNDKSSRKHILPAVGSSRRLEFAAICAPKARSVSGHRTGAGREGLFVPFRTIPGPH